MALLAALLQRLVLVLGDGQAGCDLLMTRQAHVASDDVEQFGKLRGMRRVAGVARPLGDRAVDEGPIPRHTIVAPVA